VPPRPLGKDFVSTMMDTNSLMDASNFGGPQSPVEMKPDTNLLGSTTSPSMMTQGSPSSSTSFMGFGSPGGGQRSPPPGSGGNYPPSHPLSGAKHMCSICGDRASGKHYGVYSCEGCKGFFKRTVRKELTYACREDKHCLIDKRQRNRCQFCRYNKCLSMGMKREAVQEERQRGSRDKMAEDNDGVESTSLGPGDMPTDRILEAERICDKHELDPIVSEGDDIQAKFKFAAEKQLTSLVEWAKRIPHFTELPMDDQVILLRGGWNELMIAGFSHRSVGITNGIRLASGVIVTRENAHASGVGVIFDRVLVELVSKMTEMEMDKTELGCLRAIVLFNPDVKGLKEVNKVEQLRERVYASLEEYTRSTHEHETGRFAKLLLRLPALRSIGLKCMEHLFFFKIIGENSAGLDTHLFDLLEGGQDC